MSDATATVSIAGTTSCTACTTVAATTTGSMQVAGSADGTYTLARIGDLLRLGS
jgi:hypothetical protein